MPKRKTSIGPRQLDCSDGAKMLIEQMKEHPEEFRGYGKFTSIMDTARQAVQGQPMNVKMMSRRDAIAITGAAEEHLYEVWLAEDVLTKMMTPKQEEKSWGTTTGRSSGKSVLGQGVLSNAASNATTPQYIEQVYRIALEQERRELREREDFKRREYEHAMRNTKPFKDFL